MQDRDVIAMGAMPIAVEYIKAIGQGNFMDGINEVEENEADTVWETVADVSYDFADAMMRRSKQRARY